MEARTLQNPDIRGLVRFEPRNRHSTKIEKEQPERERGGKPERHGITDAVRKGHLKPGGGISQRPTPLPNLSNNFHTIEIVRAPQKLVHLFIR